MTSVKDFIKSNYFPLVYSACNFLGYVVEERMLKDDFIGTSRLAKEEAEVAKKVAKTLDYILEETNEDWSEVLLNINVLLTFGKREFSEGDYAVKTEDFADKDWLEADVKKLGVTKLTDIINCRINLALDELTRVSNKHRALNYSSMVATLLMYRPFYGDNLLSFYFLSLYVSIKHEIPVVWGLPLNKNAINDMRETYRNAFYDKEKFLPLLLHLEHYMRLI